MSDHPTPAETARNEAAKQAVIMAFGLVSMALMTVFYKKIAARQAETLRDMLPHDPVLRGIDVEQARRDALRRSVSRWDRLSTLAFRYGGDRAFAWAWDRAQAARKAAQS